MIQNRKTIMFIVDSFNPSALRIALEKRIVPAMEFLKSRGYFTESCVSVFPTMTPTCASSIITGTSPCDHLVPGFEWFSRAERRIVNYGISPLAVWKMGIKRVVQELLFNLNHIHLSSKVKTLYESLEDQGLTTGAVNPFIFRGGLAYRPRLPLILQILSGFGIKGKLYGPGSLFLGSFCPPDIRQRLKMLLSPRHLWKFGYNDDYSGSVGRWLIKRGKQPDFLTIYLPDTDGYSHRHDPNSSEESLEKADRQICKVLGAFQSWDEALEKNTIIIVGDHSQSLVGSDRASMVRLDRVLAGFTQVNLGGESCDDSEIAVCINERMSYIYILKDREKIMPLVVERLKGVTGVDQLAWKEGDWCHIINAGGEELSFRPGRDVWDQYGQGWSLRGQPSAAGARISGHSAAYGEYPDALAQLYNALGCMNAGDLVVTAKSGYEFNGAWGPTHLGCGSHGSLHRIDALVPLFVSGSAFGKSFPRILDLAPFILSQHGLK
ncbi:MAG: hypothetical protein JL50_16940 [Peptococcaceae bacterium BICA1-7]|nr:MAG: hypothetical protein JL50_16940 [Peptococcaceae bacterium BICA1-7]HBV96520.1 alkaline phosphatase family protein [Desulfotomaculum sp.]